HVPVHPAGVARGAGHGHVECAQRVRHAGDGLELLQPGVDRLRRAARVLARSPLRSAGASRPRYRHARRRHAAARGAASGAALRFYAIGLCGYAALKVLVNAFYALERRRTPMLVSFLAVGLNLALNWTLTVRFNWGHRGLALSTACVATTNFLILYALMRSHLGRLESRAMLALLSKVALASAVLLLASWAGAHFLLADWAVQSFWPKCLS